MSEYKGLLKVIDAAKPLGTKALKDGTLLVAPAPHVAPQAWLHKVFPGLTDAELARLEKMLKREIPDDLHRFLKTMNGVSLFSESLDLYGLRKGGGRGIEAAWQPYSILTPNAEERPRDAGEEHFFFGAYGYDGSGLVLDCRTLRVTRCSRGTVKPLNTWECFDVMIEKEAERLSKLFDGQGRPKDPDAPTTPGPDGRGRKT